MKYFMLLFCHVLFLYPLSTFAQYYETGKRIDTCVVCCLFTHTIQTENSENQPVQDVTYTILEIGNNIFKYGDLSTYFKSKGKLPESYKNINLDLPEINDNFTVYQNYPEQGNYTVTEVLFPARYKYNEQSPGLQWEIKGDTATIAGYLCHKAITSYGGRVWEAWYAEDVPVPAGPWKINGLPGLVLRAKDSEGIHDFKAYTLFSPGKQNIHFEDETHLKTTDRDKFIKQRNTLKTDPRWVKDFAFYTKGSEGIRYAERIGPNNKYGLTPRIIINDVSYNIDNIRNKYQPLELK